MHAKNITFNQFYISKLKYLCGKLFFFCGGDEGLLLDCYWVGSSKLCLSDRSLYEPILPLATRYLHVYIDNI